MNVFKPFDDCMRLDKYVAINTGLSRKDVKKQIHAGNTYVNGEVCKNTGLHIHEQDCVQLEGKVLAAPHGQYIMLHKPVDYVCSTNDPNHASVLTLLNMPFAERLIIAGRLDLDTTGLVLLTDDGQWSHKVTSPNHKQPKCYHVGLDRPLTANAEKWLERGIMLKGEKKRTQSAILERISDTEVRLTLSEGRYHQVKRMFAALDNHVVRLHRESIGAIKLDPQLHPGEYRSLTAEEKHSILIKRTP